MRNQAGTFGSVGLIFPSLIARKRESGYYTSEAVTVRTAKIDPLLARLVEETLRLGHASSNVSLVPLYSGPDLDEAVLTQVVDYVMDVWMEVGTKGTGPKDPAYPANIVTIRDLLVLEAIPDLPLILQTPP